MNIRIHENDWTVLVEDVDLKEVTQEQVDVIAKYILTNTVVVIKKQQLTPADEIRIAGMFGRLQNFTGNNPGFILKDTDGYINRVSGGLDEHGRPGMFGHVTELEWHCNRVSDPDRFPIIWLYGECGTVGSKTSWLNNILTYDSLPQEKKDNFKNLKLNVGNTQQFINYYRGDEYVPQDITHYRPNLVHTNQLGVTGLFFSWNQTHFVEDMDPTEGRKLIEDLRAFCEKEKYMYHHDWEDGDVVISDQWLSIHKRWEFSDMEKRVLHRIALDFSKANLS
jgi:taurine dioxygenase